MAVSPIVAGAALKGPADRLLVELGGEASAPGVARFLDAFAGTLVIDEADADLAGEVEAAGVRCVVTATVMSDARGGRQASPAPSSRPRARSAARPAPLRDAPGA